MKMTVIIEDGDQIITTVLYKVDDAVTHVRHRDHSIRMNADGSFPPQVSKIDFCIEGVARFDPEKGNFLETKREKKDA
ncbi:hypothetical protein SEA_BRONXBAY_81 [Arthrobacter phage BronxBay]|nr:hypothetical protein PBI_STAYER_81 [Arthrobacter phage Stayer]QFG12675.1 hypothetical protein PBI_MICHELLE_81 [Arthrobacter phage Michelle]